MNMRQQNSRSREPGWFVLAALSKLDPDERIRGYERERIEFSPARLEREQHERDIGRARGLALVVPQKHTAGRRRYVYRDVMSKQDTTKELPKSSRIFQSQLRHAGVDIFLMQAQGSGATLRTY